MCHLYREEQLQPEPEGKGATPPSLQMPRPRWAMAGALALVGGLALAALVTPSSLPEAPVQQRAAAAAPMKASPAKLQPVSNETVNEHLTLGVDDAVPASAAEMTMTKAQATNCMEGL
jgi:hypothetical protein